MEPRIDIQNIPEAAQEVLSPEPELKTTGNRWLTRGTAPITSLLATLVILGSSISGVFVQEDINNDVDIEVINNDVDIEAISGENNPCQDDLIYLNQGVRIWKNGGYYDPEHPLAIDGCIYDFRTISYRAVRV